MFLAQTTSQKFKVYQTDLKSTFLNGELEEELFIGKLEGFPLMTKEYMLCKLKKVLYGLKKTPRTWHVSLDKYLENLGFAKGNVDSNLYLKEIENDLLIIVIFVDDIIFGGNDEASDKFTKEMKNEFEMSMIGEIKFFLGLQIVQNSDCIFISKDKYLKDFWKILGLESCKHVGTPMIIGHKLSSKDETPTIEQKKYRSMIGGL